MAKKEPPPIHVNSRLGILCGLKREAQLIEGAGLKDGTFIRISGTSPERTYEMARQLAQSGVAGLVSFGLCGGLAAELKPGDLVLSDYVVTEAGERWATDPAWRDKLQEIAQRKRILLHRVNTVSTDRVVRYPHEKAHLALGTRASVVDMESATLARVAAERHMPFIVLRAVADDSTTFIPPTAMKGVDDEGNTQTGAVIKGLLTRPQDTAALIKLGSATRSAERSLGRAARHLLTGLLGVVHLL